MPASVWTYRFSPMQEREQKRQYETSGNILRDGLAWTYTLLGGDKKQLATYNGVQGEFCGQNAVWMWPVEHNSYGPAQTRIITRPNGFKEFVIPDHLGSSRLTISAEGDVLQRSDYEPFGSSLAYEGVGSRTSYIGREEDGESGLGFYGVRLYEPEYGRFTSVDPLWEAYRNLTGYQYAANGVTLLVDPGGMVIEPGVNMTSERSEALLKAFAMIQSWGSPTANSTIALAVGEGSKVIFNVLHASGDGQDAVPSILYPNVDAQKEMTMEREGFTLTTKEGGDMVGEVYIRQDIFDQLLSVDAQGTPLVPILDELFHAVSTLPKSESKQSQDHKQLYSKLKNEDGDNAQLKTDAVSRVKLDVKVKEHASD